MARTETRFYIPNEEQGNHTFHNAVHVNPKVFESACSEVRHVWKYNEEITEEHDGFFLEGDLYSCVSASAEAVIGKASGTKYSVPVLRVRAVSEDFSALESALGLVRARNPLSSAVQPSS